MLMCIQNLVGFCQFILKILSGNEILMSIKGRYSVRILRKMTGNNPKLDLVNVDVHTKFGQILPIRSQDIERKRNANGITESRNHGMTEPRNHGTTEGQGESSIAPLFQSGAIIRCRYYCINSAETKEIRCRDERNMVHYFYSLITFSFP